MITISPSLLASDFMNLSEEIKRLNEIKNIWLHLDIMDGHFVPNLTFGHEIIRGIAKISDNPIDMHLMVGNPEFYINTLKSENIHNITWHLENNVDHHLLIEKAAENFSSIGLSIKPDTSVEEIPLNLLKKVNLILVMSVEPGFGGQKFMPKAIEKVKKLNELKKAHKLNFTIQVDGGVNQENAKLLTQHGANNLVAGSFVFNGNVEAQINKLKS